MGLEGVPLFSRWNLKTDPCLGAGVEWWWACRNGIVFALDRSVAVTDLQVFAMKLRSLRGSVTTESPSDPKARSRALSGPVQPTPTSLRKTLGRTPAN